MLPQPEAPGLDRPKNTNTQSWGETERCWRETGWRWQGEGDGGHCSEVGGGSEPPTAPSQTWGETLNWRDQGENHSGAEMGLNLAKLEVGDMSWYVWGGHGNRIGPIPLPVLRGSWGAGGSTRREPRMEPVGALQRLSPSWGQGTALGICTSETLATMPETSRSPLVPLSPQWPQ